MKDFHGQKRYSSHNKSGGGRPDSILLHPASIHGRNDGVGEKIGPGNRPGRGLATERVERPD